ncbi:unnamed protein product [Parascedosporium putredinis]|uniref:FAD/NAD(P)-binding domain-containing protein n=1 Tax=Parascedosporium putredinis TaxID=1442378 RepID=A0A9P1HBY4_9PEZI|nr:unnamed protein product [Parascedosporium putredinis]CAI8002491.1 unnamed protein product [Parascedosporium putredinis]
MQKTVVILGAGWAGLPLAHKLLKYTTPKVPKLKVILVSPNSHFFWNVAASRAILPKQIPDDQVFIPIQPAFERYAQENFEFILGRAENVDLQASTVTLVIATGSRLAGNTPFKLLGSHETTITAWHKMREQVEHAKSIIISGAGPTGVEFAGELAALYGSSKTITLIISGDEPLEGALAVRVTNTEEVAPAGPVEVTLTDGSTIKADMYVPFHGAKVNSAFIPDELLDPTGSIKVDKSLKVENTRNLWAIGDVGNAEPKQLTPYRPMEKKMLFIALGKKLASGHIGSWRLFGLIVSYVKGRKLFVDTAEGYVQGKHLRHAAM